MNVSNFRLFQILDNIPAAIPRLGHIQALLRKDSLEIIYSVQGREAYPAARLRIVYMGVPPPSPI